MKNLLILIFCFISLPLILSIFSCSDRGQILILNSTVELNASERNLLITNRDSFDYETITMTIYEGPEETLSVSQSYSKVEELIQPNQSIEIPLSEFSNNGITFPQDSLPWVIKLLCFRSGTDWARQTIEF